MTTLPSCRCQRRTTWAGVRSWRSAIARSSRRPARRPGRAGSRPRWRRRARRARRAARPAASCGWSSIWFTVGSCSASRLQPLQVLDAEVGDADRAAAALALDPFEGAPGVEVALLGRQRPVDQVEVDVVEAEPAAALLEGLQGRVVALLRVPELGGDEDLLARDPGGGDRGADAGLVAVGGGGVDVAVAGRQRLLDRAPGSPPAAPGRRRSRAAGSRRRRGARRSGPVPSRASLAGREADGEQREGAHDAEEGPHRGAGAEVAVSRERAPAMTPTRKMKPAIPRPIQKTGGMGGGTIEPVRRPAGGIGALLHQTPRHGRDRPATRTAN